MATQNARAAVIGLGAYGIVTVKNMLEVGFDVVGFDKNGYIGGLWKATSDPAQTSVLPKIPNHPTSGQMQQYLENYADHFNLSRHFKLGATIINIKRSEKVPQWSVVVKYQDGTLVEEGFEKVVVTTGTFHSAIMPQIPGIENFQGVFIHSQAFKIVDDFKDKSVIVVGLSNSGADATVELSKVAKKVYISHRNGARILPRLVDGNKPADHLATRGLVNMSNFLDSFCPYLMNKLVEREIEKGMRQSYPNLDPAWKLLPAPPLSHGTPIVNDHIINLLASGAVNSTAGIERITNSGAVEFTDGTQLGDIDAIICCTGYKGDFNILNPEIDPTGGSTPEYDAAPYGSSVRRYARLYQGIFSPAYPDSLAFIGPYLIISAFTGADVVSQAIAQIFSGGYPVPLKTEIENWCNDHYAWSVKLAHVGRSPLGVLNSSEVERWLNQVCGNGLDKKLGWGFEGWKFWWQEKELRDVLVNGIDTGFIYRLFDGRRKKWDDAKEAIYKSNGKTWIPKASF